MNAAQEREEAPAFSLSVLLPDGSEQRAEFPGGEIVVGRDETCAVVLESPEVSRRHATLQVGAQGLELTDLSANGTLVSGALVHSATVRVEPGSTIQIGPFLIRASFAEPRRVAPAPRAVATGTREVPADTRREIRRRLVEHLDLARLDRNRMNDHMLRAKVRVALATIIAQSSARLPGGTDIELLNEELLDETLALGPLEQVMRDPGVTEIMVLDAETVYIERAGKIARTELRFTDEEALRCVLERILMPLGRRIDESSPLVDARLKDGSRVNAVIRPLALRGTCITIRRFPERALTLDDLLAFGSLSPPMARFLVRTVRVRKNIVISGGTGSGKTTLLNVLSAAIPAGERIVTIEDAAELRLAQPHVVSLEARPPNLEGKGEIPIRALVKNALRMRPDRIVVGETRGGEALDMLQAMNTGHDGSMTTTHANSPAEALKRIETLALMSGVELPARAIREQIASAVQVIVQQSRTSDGSRKVTSIAEVLGLDDDGNFEVREIFGFRPTAAGPGEFTATGRLPTFLGDFVTQGLVAPGEDFL